MVFVSFSGVSQSDENTAKPCTCHANPLSIKSGEVGSAKIVKTRNGHPEYCVNYKCHYDPKTVPKCVQLGAPKNEDKGCTFEVTSTGKACKDPQVWSTQISTWMKRGDEKKVSCGDLSVIITASKKPH